MEKFRLTKNKKSQAWGLDAVMATIVFTIAVLILFFYAINFLTSSDEKLEEIFYEGNMAAELILDEDIGILTENRVDYIKLNNFSANYDSKKDLIGTTRDFYFTMEGLEVDNISVPYVGKMNTTATEDLIQVTRITIYKNKPVKFQLYVYG